MDEAGHLSINDALTDDDLRSVLARLTAEAERDVFGLVCKRWLRLQSSERRRLRARAGPAMLRRMADRFQSIHELDLSQSASRSFYPGVTDSDLAVIVEGFRCLRVLSLQNCKGITDSGMVGLGNGLPLLESLDVSGCRKLKDIGLAVIALNCCNLKNLHIVGCKSVTDNLLQALSEGCPRLEALALSGCTNITNSGLSVLVDGCRRIKYLDVSRCIEIGDDGASRVAERCSSSLTTLKLYDCNAVGEKSVLSLANFCNKLETLVIGGCSGILSDGCIKSLALSCGHSLRKLRMDWCFCITDIALSCVFANCRYLMALDIGFCENVTDSAFHGLRMGGFKSELKCLKVNNCPRITVSGIGTVLQFCESLEYLDLRSCTDASKVACYQAGLQFPSCCKVNFNRSLAESDCTLDVFF